MSGESLLGEDRLDALLDDGRLRRQLFLGGLLLERAPAVVEALARLRAEAVLDRPDRAAALERRARVFLGRVAPRNGDGRSSYCKYYTVIGKRQAPRSNAFSRAGVTQCANTARQRGTGTLE